MTKREADQIISRLNDKIDHSNSMAVRDETKEMGFTRFVDINLVIETVREAADDQQGEI